MRVLRIARALGPEISAIKHNSSSPLTDRHTDDLFIHAGSWQQLLPHLKAALGKAYLQGAFTHQIVTDERIKSVFVGNENFRARTLTERQEDDLINNGLSDLLGRPDLVLIRLGFLGYKNIAAPGAFQEALMIRRANKKPTWIIEEEVPFMHCKCFGVDVQQYISRGYETVRLTKVETAPKVVKTKVAPKPVAPSMVLDEPDAFDDVSEPLEAGDLERMLEGNSSKKKGAFR